MKEYVIDIISKETLKEFGYDSSQVSDETMKQIASALRHTFRECVLVNLPQIAEQYEIPELSHRCYTVSKVYVSLNDEKRNSHDTKLFTNIENARNQLTLWRNKEMALREVSNCVYTIKNDFEDSFRLSWDDDREMLSIKIA